MMKPLQIILGLSSLALLTACVTEERWPDARVERQATLFASDEALSLDPYPPRYSIDPPFGEDRVADPTVVQKTIYPIPDETTVGTYDPFKRYLSQTYYGDDGTVTRHYYLEQGMGINIAKLLAAQISRLANKNPTGDANNAKTQLIALPTTQLGPPEDDKAIDGVIVLWPSYLSDNRTVKGGYITPFSKDYNHGAAKAADLMVVKASPEKLREVDDYLTSLQNEVPLIEIQVRVAELSLSDTLQYGLSSLIEKITSGDPFLRLWDTTFNTSAFQIAGAEDFPGGLLTIGGEHDGLSLEATLEFLQRIADSEILAAPKITVLNGCRAVIVTGDRTPVAKPVIAGDQFAFYYEYKDTGITLVIVPHSLPGGMIQIQVTAEVSAVTGEETIDLGTGPIQLPIISKRNLGTKLRVEDGKEFIIGGLYSYSDINVVSKIPILGDIPVIGYLFKSQFRSKAKSEILFHVTPRVVRGPHGLIEREKEGP